MNRNFLPEAVLAVSFGLFLVTALAATATQARRRGWLRRGAVVATLVYGLIVVPLVMQAGGTLISLLAIAGMLLLPLVSAYSAARLTAARGDTVEPLARRIVRGAVAAGLLTVVLTAAAQAISLLGRLDPRMVVLLVTGAAVFIAWVNGVVGTSRVGSWAAWLLLLGIAVIVAMAALLGTASDVFDPRIEVAALSPGQWVALPVALFVLGWADPLLRKVDIEFPGAHVARVGGAVVGIVLVSGFALLMFFGGSTQAPTLQFFTLPANLDIVPGPMLIILSVMTVLFVAQAAGLLWGAGRVSFVHEVHAPDPVRPDWRRVVAVATAAAVLTLLGVGLERVAVVSSLLAAAVLGSQLRRGSEDGLLAGAVAAVVGAVVLLVSGQLRFDWAALVVLVLVIVVAAVVTVRGQPRPAAPVPAATAA
jgi:hypothetical protein